MKVLLEVTIGFGYSRRACGLSAVVSSARPRRELLPHFDQGGATPFTLA